MATPGKFTDIMKYKVFKNLIHTGESSQCCLLVFTVDCSANSPFGKGFFLIFDSCCGSFLCLCFHCILLKKSQKNLSGLWQGFVAAPPRPF